MYDLVSLIVPVYNGEKYIENFFGFINKQTYKNLEIIFIDDGSTDDSLLKLKEIAKRDKRVSVYKKNNGGPSSARNYGVSKAKGNYIAFADIDDFILPDYIGYMYELLIRHNADISYCSYIKVKDTEKYDKKKKYRKRRELVFNKEEAIKFFCYRKFLTGYSVLKLLKKEIAKEIAFDESIVYGEDFIYSYEVLKKCNKIVFGDKIQYVYVQYQESSTHVKRDNTLKYQNSWVKHLEIMEDVKKNFPEAYRGIIGKCYILAINNTTRIYDKVRDKEFNDELYQFIKENAGIVAGDKFSKINNRLLGILGKISPKGICVLCGYILSSNIQFLQRRTI